ncbi:MAG: UDP-glucose 4-epimerase GalE [Planctomycetota bacterium]|nr:MAG: UDP-glucose 4-epimerase GalE [Planctomycetota bacterium]
MLLVTGGAGYIGSHAVRALRAAGHGVVVYDDLSEGHADAVLGAPLVQADILDTERLEQTLREHQVQAVLHFAARCYVGESMERPELYWRINRDGTRSLIRAMQSAGVDKLVFSSTCAVYGLPPAVPIVESTPRAPVNVYGETKAAMEDEIAASDLRAVVFRYFNAAGASADGVLGERHDPETHLLPLALRAAETGAPLTLNGDDYPTPDGTCLRDYVHVEDLADAHVLGVQHLLDGGASLTANLGYGAPQSVRQVIASVERVTGRAVPVKIGPRRPGDPPELWAAADRAREQLGWTPRHTDLDTLVEHAWRAPRA